MTSVSFSSSGKYLLSCGGDSCVKLWDVGSGRLVHTYEGAMPESKACCLSHDESFIIAAGEEGCGAIVWSVTSGEVVQRCSPHTRSIGAIAHSPVEPAFVTCAEGQVRLWWAES